MSEDAWKELKSKIENVNEDLISTSIDEARCVSHLRTSEEKCDGCEKVKELVRKFQTHGCTFSCKKKKKYLT